MAELFHPELFEGIFVTGQLTADALTKRANYIEPLQLAGHGVTVAIRCRNEADELELLLDDIQRQDVPGQLEVIIIDNESTDHTKDVAANFGARVVNLPISEFTYPRSMNLSMQQAAFDNVFLTVGHALLSTDQTLRAGILHMTGDDAVGGVFSRTLPSYNASRTERALAAGNFMFMAKSKNTKKASLGVLAAQGAFVDRRVWEELGKFDERYQTGGEDTVLAGEMIKSGYRVIEEPALAVHHTHGLGIKDTVSQWRHWIKTNKGPQPLEMDRLLARRPDLRAKYGSSTSQEHDS